MRIHPVAFASMLVASGLFGTLIGCGGEGGSGVAGSGGTGPDGGVDADAEAGEGDTGVDVGEDADVRVEAGATTWSDCPLYADESSQRLAECAMIDVQLRAAEPGGPTIEIWVQRLMGTAPEIMGQIWFLEGGPGGSGADLAGFLDDFSTIDPRWDLYTLDHRGVGRSARLGCPAEEAPGSEAGFYVSDSEWPSCIQTLQDTWGDDLDEFTTSGAARDLGSLIEMTRQPEQDVFVFGVSYGTYWATRYLQLFPDQASGVILDSIAPPGETFVSFDVYFDDVGEDFVAYCQADALCASKLGPDPWGTVGQVFADVSQGSCPGLTTLVGAGNEHEYLRYTLGVLLMDVWTRAFLPAVVYRVNRCNADDEAAVEQLLLLLFGDAQPSIYDQLMSYALFNHVALSELWDDPLPDAAEIAATTAALYVGVDVSPSLASLQNVWPTYPRDQYVGNWPTTAVPLLMMNGDLDPQTPIWVAQEAEAHLNGAYQYFFTLPRSAHGVVAESPVASAGQYPCGFQMMLDFIDDARTSPSGDCLADIVTVDFSGNNPYSPYLFGTDDMWENGAAASQGSKQPKRLKPPGLDRVLRKLRRTVSRRRLI